ncbi:MAG: hypothetical protein Q4D53_06215 [Leptotrichiaceae bacterium]|nr:hypothetical protein [Leptotrichiaceae bacterium]
MKKFLIGLFLLGSFSVLAEQNENNVQKTNSYYIIDAKSMSRYSKEKADFKKQFEILAQKDDRKNLIVLLKKYIEKYPEDEYAYEMIGTFYDNLKNYKEAEKYYLKAIELGNEDTGVYSLFLLYEELNKKMPEKYKKYIEKLKSSSHEGLKQIRDHKTFSMIGNEYSTVRLMLLYHDNKNYRVAERYALEVLKFDEENVEAATEAVYILDNIYKSQKNYKKLEKLLISLAQKGDMNGQYMLAKMYYEDLKNYEEAEKWAKKLLETTEKEKFYDGTEFAKDLLKKIENSKLRK